MIFCGLSVVMAMLGIYALLSRKTLLGWVFGLQLIFQALVSFGVFIGHARHMALKGQAIAFFLMVLGLSGIVASIALSVRMFYLRKNTRMDVLKELRH